MDGNKKSEEENNQNLSEKEGKQQQQGGEEGEEEGKKKKKDASCHLEAVPEESEKAESVSSRPLTALSTVRYIPKFIWVSWR